MPHYVFDGDETFPSTAYDLGIGDTLEIRPGAVLTGSGVYVPLIRSFGSTVLNAGTVSGAPTQTLIAMSGGASLVNSGEIGFNGYVFASAPPVILVGASDRPELNSIYNAVDGSIIAHGSARFYSNPAIRVEGNAHIENHGVIDSWCNAIVTGTGGFAGIVNYGTIHIPNWQLTTYSAVTIYGDTVGQGAANFINFGHVEGAVRLGGGSFLNEAGGYVQGPVNARHIVNHGMIESTSARPIISGPEDGTLFNENGIINSNVEMGAGADTVVNTGSIGQVNLGAGDDLLDSRLGTILGIFGGDGNDTIYGGAQSDNIFGDNSNADTGGNDELWGGAGNDVIYGGHGMDTIYGNQDIDILFGNQGDDWIHGGKGDDILAGGKNDDVLNGGVGDDRLYGNLGNDTFVFSPNFGGRDQIEDFSATTDNNDVIQFEPGTFASYADVQAHMAQEGADVVITLDPSNSIRILNTDLATLTSDHFLFG